MKKTYYKEILIILFIIILIAGLRFSGALHYLNLETLKENRAYLYSYANSHYWFSVLLYILLYILAAAFPLPIAASLTLIGGFLFGVFGAVIYTNLGASIGAICIFLMTRYLARDLVQTKFHHKLDRFDENIKIYGANYLLISRLIVVVPFFLVNILAALTKIPLFTFIWTTSLGIIPGSIVYAYAGRQIINISSIKDIFTFKVILAFLILIIFSLVPIFFKKNIKNNLKGNK